MSEPFVPFSLKALPVRSGAKSEPVITGAKDAKAFQPFADDVHLGSATSGACEPHITLEKDGDRITRIRVQCPCGSIIDLACS